MKNLLGITLILLALLIGLSGCRSDYKPSYGFTRTAFPAAAQKASARPKLPPCDTRGNIVKRSDANCVGQVIKSEANGPTITVLQPGLAVPMADVDAATLAPPQR